MDSPLQQDGVSTRSAVVHGEPAGEARPARPEPSDARPRRVLLIVGLGTFVSAASGSTVNLALPDISRDLAIPIDVAGWVVSSFLLVVTVLLLVAGRASDLLGHRRVYLAGLLLFGAAALCCGLATNAPLLIGARLVQGVGGAMVMATGPALLTTTFPPTQRGRALGMLSTATYAGLTIGPPLGGWVVQAFSWRWVFFVNLPAAVVIATLGVTWLPRAKARAVVFDWGGALTVVGGLPLVLLALARGQHWGWTSWRAIGAAALGLILLVTFVTIERRRPQPLLDLGLFRSRMFTGAVLSALGNYVALFVPIILLPFYFIEAMGVDAKQAGMLLSAQSLVMALVASPAGRLSDRIGSRGLATAGMVILAAGLVALASLGLSPHLAAVVAALAVVGLGTGVFISPNSSALMGAAPRAQQGVAGGVMAVARTLGMMVGVVAATSIYQAAGGQTGRSWTGSDYQAFRVALLVAAGVSLLSALAAAMRGTRRLTD